MKPYIRIWLKFVFAMILLIFILELYIHAYKKIFVYIAVYTYICRFICKYFWDILSVNIYVFFLYSIVILVCSLLLRNSYYVSHANMHIYWYKYKNICTYVHVIYVYFMEFSSPINLYRRQIFLSEYFWEMYDIRQS